MSRQVHTRVKIVQLTVMQSKVGFVTNKLFDPFELISLPESDLYHGYVNDRRLLMAFLVTTVNILFANCLEVILSRSMYSIRGHICENEIENSQTDKSVYIKNHYLE